MTHGLRLFLRNSAYVVIGHASTTVFALAYAVVLARVLGRESYAVLAFGFAWYLSFIALSYLGIDVVLARRIGTDRTDAPRLSGSTLVLRAIAASAVSAVSVATGVLVAPDRTSRMLIAVMGTALISRSVWLWCTAIFTAFEDTRKGLLVDLGCRPLEFTLGVAVLVLGGKSVIAIGVVHALAWAAQATIGLLVVTRLVTPIDLRSSLGDLKRLVRTGWPGALYSLAVIWFLQAPIVLFTGAGLKDDRGPFALTVQIVGYLMVIPYLAGSVGLPLLSRSAARQDGKTRLAVRATLVGVPLAGAVLGVATLALGPTLVDTVFGPQFASTGHMLQLAVWLVVPMTVAISMQQIIFAGEEAGWLGIAPAVTGVLVMAASFWPATAAWGYRGAFAATGAGLGVWAAAAVVLVLSRATYRR